MLRPIGDKVVVEVFEEEEKTAGGIFLPDTAKKKPQEGRVVAVGPGRVLQDGTRAPMSVKVGDRVIFSKYGGNEVEVDGKEYTILDEDQIYAIREG
ncbi:MAG: 10 kDa chaperonin [Armatimonadota bacterium]|jgi:chaperonin GroES|nr:co-chaperone GroES [Bacillota bacterium]NSW80685.1 co-chaperone GroES [Chthonomonadetes bacterium]GBC95392.1 10 kDa chaperonin [bacterium HR16]GIV16967.1 MAG: 10 kDa chaperonin [Armatimonadota bacterium]GIV18369.1 MAG: 10 kDa chaperonin [Armatimonadota bacterium]